MKNRTEVDITNYKNYRNLYNKTKRNMKIEYYTTKVNECKNNNKKLWKIINEILRKHKHKGSLITHISINGVKTYNPFKIANAFGEFYSTLGANLAKQIKGGVNNIQHYLKRIPQNLKSMVMKQTTHHEVESLIKKLPNKESFGHDMISNNLLKSLCNSLSLPLSYIFNQSILEGTFPDQMKKVEVIPLYKGKDNDQLVNYWPISLLLTISKLLEKKVYKCTIKFINKYNLLYDSQYGFRSKRSCESATLELIGNILDSKNANKHSCALFLELSKAFDTINHEMLLKKLDLYGIRGICNDWFKNYLTGFIY